MSVTRRAKRRHRRQPYVDPSITPAGSRDAAPASAPHGSGGGGRRLNVLYFGFLSIVALLFLGFAFQFATSYPARAQTAALFHRSQGCGSVARRVSRATPCRNETAQILKLYKTGTGQGTIRGMLVQPVDGRHYRFNVDNSTPWEEAHTGQWIEVQIWAGRVDMIRVDGDSSRTFDNPDSRVENSLLNTAGMLSVVMLCVGLMIASRLIPSCARPEFKQWVLGLIVSMVVLFGGQHLLASL